MSTLNETFIFGMANSLHCAGMCGPLAVCFQGGASGAVGYHFGRVVSYAALGAVAGAIGTVVGAGGGGVPSAWVSIGLAAFLVGIAIGMPRVLSGGWTPPFLKTLFARLRVLPPFASGVGLGLVTPFLPCGVLYIAAGTALVSGSTVDGAAALAAFALGSLPILALAQVNLRFLSTRLSATVRARLYRWLMIVAAGVLMYRGIADLLGGGCCH